MSDVSIRRGGVPAASSDITSRDASLSGDGTAFSPLRVAFPAGGSAFLVEIITIYARTSGSDLTGDGSLATPYRTFQRAIVDVPAIFPPGRRYIVDITGIGIETLPQDYQFPVAQSTTPRFGYAPTAQFPYYFVANALTIRAAPALTLAIPAADAVVSAAATPTVSADASTNLVTLTIATPRASWGSTDLSGKHLIRTALGFPLATCVIRGSDSTHLFLCNDAGQFNGGTGALVLAAGETLQIVEPSATLQGPAPAVSRLGNAAITVANASSVNFQGIGFRCTSGVDFALMVSGTPNPFFELCTIEGLTSIGVAQQIALHSTNLSSLVDCEATSFTIFNSLMHDVVEPFIDGEEQVFFCSEIRNCDPLETDAFVGAIPVSTWGFANCLISGSTGDAIQALGGRYALSFVQINDSGGNAISASSGSNYLLLDHVTGTGNSGIGVLATDGAQVQVADTATNVTGTGGDMKSGSQVVRSWTNFYGTTPVGNEFDLVTPFVADSHGTLKPRGQESGAPCTGTRIFQRTP